MCLCDVTLSIYPHRAGLKNMPGQWAGLKNMPGHDGIRTYDLWNTRYIKCIYKQNNDMYSLYVLDYFCYKEQLPSTCCHIHFICTIDLSWHYGIGQTIDNQRKY
jgi:hypothetical protein